MNKIALYFTVFILLVPADTTFGQVTISTEEETLTLAHNLYISSEYAEAGEFYKQLVSRYPSNNTYHYFYGVCMVISSKNKKESILHLEKAAASGDAPLLVYYYLGKACHLNYEFDKAIGYFGLLKEKAGESLVKELKADGCAATCMRAKGIDFTGRKKAIIQQTEIQEEIFFTAYHFSKNQLMFLTMPDWLIKEKGNKEKLSEYIFVSASGKWMVFSCKDKSGYQTIYLSKRKSADGWNDAEVLKFTTELKFDMINPTISDDGKTIYFSSDCEGSIGGYDIFSTVLDSKTKKWTSPVHLEYPVNSVDDDFYYVLSKEDGFSYVGSKRECEHGKLNVIRISLSENIPPARSDLQITNENKKENFSVMTKKEMSNIFSSDSKIYIPEHLENSVSSINPLVLPSKIIALLETEDNSEYQNMNSDKIEENTGPLPVTVNPEQEENLVYKIQIGAYRKKTIKEIMHKFELLGIKNIEHFTRKNGVNVFLTYYSKNLLSAITERDLIVKKGIADAFIVAFSGKQQISIAEAFLQKK